MVIKVPLNKESNLKYTIQFHFKECDQIKNSNFYIYLPIHSKHCEIFLFTSDRNEGWGAVLNESMNSGCAVVSSHAIGSTPFLLEDSKNGLIYKNGDIADLYNKVKYLLDNPEKRRLLGKNAYDSILTLWNPRVAAERFLVIAKQVLEAKATDVFFEGPCSSARRLKDDWFLKKKR